MSVRRARTILLLESRTDWMPQPRSQFAAFGAIPGEAATRRETCSRCRGECEIPTRLGPEPCDRCDGEGSYLVDAYTGERSSSEGPFRIGALSAVEKDRKAVATIARMGSQIAPPKSERDLIEDANKNPEPWERQREAHYKHGSYRELDLALEWLGGGWPEARQLVEWAYEFHVIAIGKCSPDIVRAAEACVDRLCERMPDPVRVPAWLLPAHPAEVRIARKMAA